MRSFNRVQMGTTLLHIALYIFVWGVFYDVYGMR